MKLHFSFLTQSGLIVVTKKGDSMLSLGILKKIVGIIKEDFPDANDQNTFIEHLCPPECKDESYSVIYEYGSIKKLESVPQKYRKLNR